jgi:hypothetical protein
MAFAWLGDDDAFFEAIKTIQIGDAINIKFPRTKFEPGPGSVPWLAHLVDVVLAHPNDRTTIVIDLPWRLDPRRNAGGLLETHYVFRARGADARDALERLLHRLGDIANSGIVDVTMCGHGRRAMLFVDAVDVEGVVPPPPPAVVPRDPTSSVDVAGIVDDVWTTFETVATADGRWYEVAVPVRGGPVDDLEVSVDADGKSVRVASAVSSSIFFLPEDAVASTVSATERGDRLIIRATRDLPKREQRTVVPIVREQQKKGGWWIW